MKNNEIEKIDIDFKEYTNNKTELKHEELVDVYKKMIVDIRSGKYDSDSKVQE